MLKDKGAIIKRMQVPLMKYCLPFYFTLQKCKRNKMFLFISISVPCVFYLYFQVVNDTGDISPLLPNLNWILLLLMVGRSLGTFW